MYLYQVIRRICIGRIRRHTHKKVTIKDIVQNGSHIHEGR